MPSPSSLQSWLILLAGGALSAWIVKVIVDLRKRNPKRLPYPPGPKGHLIVGNLAQIPQDQPWVGYHEICKKYGDIVRLQVLGTEILVLDSIKHAIALLEKRAVNYSDRPDIPVAHITETYWAFSIMPYGDVWRQHRRVFHHYLGQNAVAEYHPIAHFECDRFLRRLKDNPADFLEHIKLFIGTTIMRTTYGFDDIGKNAELIHTAEVVVREFGLATAPGRYLVSAFPVLRHVPAWFPGAGWKRYMKEVAKSNRQLLHRPFNDAKDNLAKGNKPAFPSMVASLVDGLLDFDAPERAQSEQVARNVCAQSYSAGNESTSASATALIIALANNPGVQRKAQAELDVVVGSHRLPVISDRPSLPYVHAVVKELVRWYAAAPLGFVHSSTEDDEYDGYFIPKGTLIIPNVWAMTHDPATFERPDDFEPERYLKDGRIDPSVTDGDLASFGFGRRICPGKYFANDLLFVYAASLLATFDIAPPRNDNGQPVKLEMELSSGVVGVPCPFECTISARPEREGLLA